MNKRQRLALQVAARIRESMAMMHGGRPSLGLPETAWLEAHWLARPPAP